jgi:CDP-glucose 4,6-dehydratase
VLEPLAGYMLLAHRLHADPHGSAAQAWNFGPSAEGVRTVAEVADGMARLWEDGAAWVPDNPPSSYEARLLAVDSAKAIAQLGWRPRWNVDEALQRTVHWYKRQASNDDIRAVSLAQIAEYSHAA